MLLERRLSGLFRRCVQCPNVVPQCPECPPGESCSLNAESCDQCASASCMKVASQDDPQDDGDGNGGSTTPAIAGGVAGGVLFIIVVTFLVWWFCIRNRRREWDDQAWSEGESVHAIEKRDQAGLNREARESTRSMGSIASTVRTRASNVIQIAYIPGVTNRSSSHSPGLAHSPVPPVPIPSVSGPDDASPSSAHDRRSPASKAFRDSALSDSDVRQSLSPSLARSSAATFYPNHAELSARPAQQALRGRAAVVTVNKSGNNTPPDAGSPADSTGSQTPGNAMKGLMGSPIVARNVTARPIEVKRSASGKKHKTSASGNLVDTPSTSKAEANAEAKAEEGNGPGDKPAIGGDPKEKEWGNHLTPHAANPRKQSQYTEATSISSVSELNTTRPSPLHLAAPLTSRFSFSPPSTAPPNTGRTRPDDDGLDAMIEEATSRAARRPNHSRLGGASQSADHKSHPSVGHSDSASLTGPFSDANEVLEGDSSAEASSK